MMLSITREEALAAGLKLAAALPVLRWPLAGAAISILADGLDVVVMNYVNLGGGGIRDYHAFDKWTDLFGLVTFFLVTLGWKGRDRVVAAFLFALRMVGIACSSFCTGAARCSRCRTSSSAGFSTS